MLVIKSLNVLQTIRLLAVLMAQQEQRNSFGKASKHILFLSLMDVLFVLHNSVSCFFLFIKLNSEADEKASFLTVMRSFSNLGPILDMCVVDLERQGQGQVMSWIFFGS